MKTLPEWLKEKRELAEKATAGEWTYSVDAGTQTAATLYVIDEYGDEIDVASFEEWDGAPEEQITNAAFITDARLSLPVALRIIEALVDGVHHCLSQEDAREIAERIINEGGKS